MATICPICHDSLTEVSGNRSVVVALRCGHLFHQACVNRWHKKSKTCPSCNAKCQGSTSLRVYPVEEEGAAPGAREDLQEEVQRLKQQLDATLADNADLTSKMKLERKKLTEANKSVVKLEMEVKVLLREKEVSRKNHSANIKKLDRLEEEVRKLREQHSGSKTTESKNPARKTRTAAPAASTSSFPTSIQLRLQSSPRTQKIKTKPVEPSKTLAVRRQVSTRGNMRESAPVAFGTRSRVRPTKK